METHKLMQGDLEPCSPEPSLFSRERRSFVRVVKTNILTATLALSILLNVISLFFVIQRDSHPPTRSQYAHLARNVNWPFYETTPYSDQNETTAAELWQNINIDYGVVALSDDYVASKGLVPAQRFPWDETKGIYILHGFHNLHCLKVIYISMDEYRRGEKQSRQWHHVAHCFDALRRQILCDADDTPRATERRPEAISGVGQYRQCRNWKELERWAQKHTACYKRPDRPVAGMHNIEKYKFCPEDSGYVIKDDVF